MPLAFFCTLFFRHRKKSVSAPWDGQSQFAPESARQTLPGAEVCACGRTKGLSSGQTIGAVRTAVRPACCLPELQVANRLRRLCPPSTRFPPFPPAPLRGLGASSPAMRPLPPFPQNSIQILLRGSDGIQPIGLYQRLYDSFRQKRRQGRAQIHVLHPQCQ